MKMPANYYLFFKSSYKVHKKYTKLKMHLDFLDSISEKTIWKEKKTNRNHNGDKNEEKLFLVQKNIYRKNSFPFLTTEEVF